MNRKLSHQGNAAAMPRSRAAHYFPALWRLLRRAMGGFWRSPRWVKLAVPLLAAFFAASLWLSGEIAHRNDKKAIFDKFYPYYYSVYLKTYPDYLARHYARFYAEYYADYYTSAQYTQALQFALPEATPQAFVYPKTSPVAAVTIDGDGLEMIKEFEGFRAAPYFDQGGKLTIGYGHLIRRGEVYARLSVSEGENLLLQDVRLAEAVVKRSVKVPLRQRQFSALVSLVYNIGEKAFMQSTLLYYLNNGNYTAAAAEFDRWTHVGKNHSRGLAYRRAKEKWMFSS